MSLPAFPPSKGTWMVPSCPNEKSNLSHCQYESSLSLHNREHLTASLTLRDQSIDESAGRLSKFCPVCRNTRSATFVHDLGKLFQPTNNSLRSTAVHNRQKKSRERFVSKRCDNQIRRIGATFRPTNHRLTIFMSKAKA